MHTRHNRIIASVERFALFIDPIFFDSRRKFVFNYEKIKYYIYYVYILPKLEKLLKFPSNKLDVFTLYYFSNC